MDFWDALLSDLDVKILIFARILGIFTFNPMLARSNIPARVRIGLTLLITYAVSLTLNVTEVDTGNTMGTYAMCFIREMFIGLVLGYVCDVFIYMIYVAGDIMDSQAGLGMAKVFDPASRIQMSMYGSYMGFIMYLYFFAANGHLTLVKIFVDSFEAIPLCSGYLNAEIGVHMLDMFTHIFTLMIQLAMPVVAAELIVEICVGVLMKAVPQIQIMVVNIQLKVALGFFMIFAITSPIAEFIADYMDNMLNTCKEVLPLIFK